MTDFAPANFPPRALAGVTGVSPAEGRPGLMPGRPGPRPVVLVAIHGILTRSTDASWPASCREWCARRAPHVRVVTSDYYELPLPRLAAIRNPRRARELHAEVTRAAREVRARFGDPVEVHIITHSNGGVLALQMLRQRSPIWTALQWTAIAPALRRKSASREVGEMLRDGRLYMAHLVRPMKDQALAFAGRRRIATWPWGDLGLSGWDLDAMGPIPRSQPTTTDLPEDGHSDPLRPGRREETFEYLLGPGLGLTPLRPPSPRPESYDGATWGGGAA